MTTPHQIPIEYTSTLVFQLMGVPLVAVQVVNRECDRRGCVSIAVVQHLKLIGLECEHPVYGLLGVVQDIHFNGSK